MSRKARRMSIHHSAANTSRNGYLDTNNMPALPQLHRTTTNQSIILNGTYATNNQAPGTSTGAGGAGVTDLIRDLFGDDIYEGNAAMINESYKVIVKNQAKVNKDIKANINENQKNILELTNDLKDTQEELLQLRISKNELYEILEDFKEAAERRIAIETDSKNLQQQNRLNGKSMKSANAASKRKDRSSIIYLEKMWNDQLMSLFKHVEGASKFIQPIPGRHILSESGRWSEINVGNWKVVKPAHLFILNDVILVATKKTNSNSQQDENGQGSKSKLLAAFCWPLHDIIFSQINPPEGRTGGDDNNNKTYTINIKSHSMSYIYQTDRYDHFIKILEAIKKGQNELSQKERAFELANEEKTRSRGTDEDDKKLLRESIRNSGIIDGATVESINRTKSGTKSKRNSADVVLQDLSAKVHSRNRSHDFKNGTPRMGSPSLDKRNSSGAGANISSGQFFADLKKIDDRIDEVDVEIAHNNFEESVDLIRYIENKILNIEASLEQNSRRLQTTSQEDSVSAVEDEIKLLIEVINIKISSRKVKIQNNLIFELQHNITILEGEEISKIMEFFYGFDQVEEGVNAYLNAMSTHLNVTASKLIVGIQGSTRIDVVNYLSSMVIIYISIIKRTISTYKENIIPVLVKDQTRDTNPSNPKEVTIDSSGLIDWCTEEMTKLVDAIRKHLYGTLVTISSHDPVTEEPEYKVKDTKLFNEFVGIVLPQLDELKKVGVNMDFVFQDIFLLRYA